MEVDARLDRALRGLEMAAKQSRPRRIGVRVGERRRRVVKRRAVLRHEEREGAVTGPEPDERVVEAVGVDLPPGRHDVVLRPGNAASVARKCLRVVVDDLPGVVVDSKEVEL
jgi:hypothetical protein